VTAEPSFYEFGPFRAVPATGTLLRDGEPVALAPKAFETLLALLRHNGRLVTKDALMEAVWPDTFVEEGNLAFNISVLRKALGEGPDRRYVETVPRRGYRFVGGIRTPSAPVAAAAAPATTRTVGRQAERAVLAGALDAARKGTGQLLCITGEPGLGKTTLVEGFLAETVAPSGARLLRGRCSERLVGAGAYLPFLEALDDLLAGEAADTAEPLLRTHAPSWHALVVRASVAVEAASQERLKHELLTFLQAMCRSSPVVLFVDDFHWADVSTTDLLAYLGHRVASLPLLLVVCYRASEMVLEKHPFPRVQLELRGRGACRELALGYLAAADVAAYLDAVFPRHAFAPAFAGFLHAKTEGNPLFVADVLHDLHKQGVIEKRGDGYALSKQVLEIERDLPESVRSVIERKIAQLDETGRKLLTAASIQGHEFDSTVLAAVVGLPIEEVEDRLESLERAHALIRRLAERELPDGALSLRCRFVHGLYQTALHATLSPARRASLALAVATELAARYGARADEISAQLAMQFETGRDFARATEFFTRAAATAVQVFAYPEVVNLARRGLSVLARLPAGPERDAREVQLQTLLGVALMSMEGFATPDVEAVYQRALELSRALGPSPQLFPVLGGLWLFHTIRARLATARELAETILARATEVGDPVLLAHANQTVGVTTMDRGELERSVAHFAASIEHYDPRRHRERAVQYPFDPGVAARAALGRVLVPLGRPDSALARADEAIALARELGHPPSLGFALTFGAIVHYLRDEPAAAEARATETIALSREHGMAQSLGWGLFWQGWARTELGRADEGIAQMRGALDAYRRIGSRISRPKFLGLLANALRRCGHREEALELLDEALAECRETGERYCEPELLLFRGRALTDLHRGDDANAMLAASLASARDLGARWWVLRAAVELAAAPGADAGARASVAAALGEVSEGAVLPLAQRAAALL
jgi:predicted ATPase